MSDKGYDAPKSSKPELRYAEFTPSSLREAAGFAVNSFTPQYASPNMQRRLGVELSDDQRRMASFMREIYHQSSSSLPSAELSAARTGYGEVTSSISEIIPHHLKRPPEDLNKEIQEQGDASIRDDPTGVSLLKDQVQQMETKARDAAGRSREKIEESKLVGARMAFDQYKRAVDFYLTKWGTKS